jgi:hypothetical protein
MTSGAIQYGDPMTVRRFMMVSVNCADMPKSPGAEKQRVRCHPLNYSKVLAVPSFALPSLDSNIFPDFTSCMHVKQL